MTLLPQSTTFSRLLWLLAAGTIVLFGIRFTAPILSPILFALILTLIFAPLQAWFLQRGLRPWLAVVLVLVLVAALLFIVFLLVSTSIARLSSGLVTYADQMDQRTAAVDQQLDQLGLNRLDLSVLYDGSTMRSILLVVISALASIISGAAFVLFLLLFFLGEGPSLVKRIFASMRPNDVRIHQLIAFGHAVTVGFGLRAIVNLITGAGIAICLFLLGIDYPLLWGILTFFLSFVPYIGITLAAVPPVLLAWAEYGIERALLVILAVTVVNLLAENALAPALMGRGLNLSPTVVFISFAIWFWLLGPSGAFLAMPLTVFMALMLDTFPETRWLANVIMIRPQGLEGVSGNAGDALEVTQ